MFPVAAQAIIKKTNLIYFGEMTSPADVEMGTANATGKIKVACSIE